MPNITTVTVTFGHGIKREEYGPTKKAEVSLTASVSETEDGAVILAQIGNLALAKVADLLSAAKPDTVSSASIQQANEVGPAPGEPPARRTRGPNKPKDEPTGSAQTTGAEPAAGDQHVPSAPSQTEPDSASVDEWESTPDAIEVTDQELLTSLSARASALGGRDACVKLIASFATRTEGAPFKVQEIPQAQRRDFLTKLAALTA